MGRSVCRSDSEFEDTCVKLTETSVAGVMRIDIAPTKDTRGFFARSFCAEFLANAGYPFTVAQENISFNDRAATLRGLHYQAGPAGDPKIVRCERGAIWDVAIDLRPTSPTYLRWTSANLTAKNAAALFIPAGCAHGFISLEDASQILYLMGAPYLPKLSRGVRWDDPAFGIRWPIQPAVISERDATYADYRVC